MKKILPEKGKVKENNNNTNILSNNNISNLDNTNLNLNLNLFPNSNLNLNNLDPKFKRRKNIVNDLFNNEFAENNLIKKIKKEKNLEFFDYNTHKIMNNLDEKNIKYFNLYENKDKENNYYVENNSPNFDNFQRAKNFNEFIPNKYLHLLGLKKNKKKENNNKNILIRLQKHKLKWERNYKENILKNHKKETSKFFNNVMLIRPEIMQSKKQIQYNILNNKDDKNSKLNYLNFILGKANEKKVDEKIFHKQQIYKKITNFANRIEDFERKKLNKLKEIPKEFKDDKSNSKVISEKYDENDYDSDNDNGFDLDDRLLDQAKKKENILKNLKKDSDKYPSLSITESAALASGSPELNSNTNIITPKGIHSSIGSNFSTGIIIRGILAIGRKSKQFAKIICDKILSIYFKIVEIVSADHNKSYAYKKINWVGKYGEFPEEFKDNRIIENPLD
jgi:hypothetical protein